MYILHYIINTLEAKLCQNQIFSRFQQKTIELKPVDPGNLTRIRNRIWTKSDTDPTLEKLKYIK